MKKWNRKLGSKRSQGIPTPKAPQNRSRNYVAPVPIVILPWYKKLWRRLFKR